VPKSLAEDAELRRRLRSNRISKLVALTSFLRNVKSSDPQMHELVSSLQLVARDLDILNNIERVIETGGDLTMVVERLQRV